MVAQRLFFIAAATLVATVSPHLASAVGHHERVKIKAVKDTKGKVVGMNVSLVIRPEGYTAFRIGIGPGTAKTFTGADHQKAAALPEAGYLLHQFPIQKADKGTAAVKLSFDVLYKDAPKIKPGAPIQVITAFDHAKDVWHVWGMSRGTMATGEVFTAPGKKAAKRRASLSSIKRERPRTTKRRHRRRASRKPPARGKAKPRRTSR